MPRCAEGVDPVCSVVCVHLAGKEMCHPSPAVTGVLVQVHTLIIDTQVNTQLLVFSVQMQN